MLPPVNILSLIGEGEGEGEGGGEGCILGEGGEGGEGEAGVLGETLFSGGVVRP